MPHGSLDLLTGQSRLCSIAVALSVLPGFLSAQDQPGSAARYSVRKLADGKQWTTVNLSVNTVPSYCYDDSEANCLRYGRLYTWESAGRACKSLGDGWRLPAEEEWRQLAKHYGGINDDSKDRGKGAYNALSEGGEARFNAVLGGGRSGNGQYRRLDAHGFYWTASENREGGALFYNFGKGSQGLYRQTGGEKEEALAVRCVNN